MGRLDDKQTIYSCYQLLQKWHLTLSDFEKGELLWQGDLFSASNIMIPWGSHKFEAIEADIKLTHAIYKPSAPFHDGDVVPLWKWTMPPAFNQCNVLDKNIKKIQWLHLTTYYVWKTPESRFFTYTNWT